jgi:preprotein translocase subunit SecA
LYVVERTYEVVDFDNLILTEQNEIREKLYLQNVLQQILLALTVYERDIDYLVEGGKVKISFEEPVIDMNRKQFER